MLKKDLVCISLALLVSCVLASCAQHDDPPVPPALPSAGEGSGAATDGPVARMAEYYASPATETGGNCALDAVDGALATSATAKSGADVLFAGWFADQTNQVPTNAKLVLRGDTQAYSAPIEAGGLRPDVADALNAEALRLSGYNSHVRLDVPPGNYRLSIVHGRSRKAQECQLGVSLTVTR